MNRPSALALVLVELDGVPAKLIAAHVADDRGHCRGCALPQSPPTRWPCTTYATATEAQAIAEQRRTGR